MRSTSRPAMPSAEYLSSPCAKRPSRDRLLVTNTRAALSRQHQENLPQRHRLRVQRRIPKALTPSSFALFAVVARFDEAREGTGSLPLEPVGGGADRGHRCGDF